MKCIKKLISLFLSTGVLASAILMFGLIQPQKAEAAGNPITLAGFGHRISTSNTNGDTWETTWLANDKVHVQHNDGTGFNNGANVHDRICELLGSPETPSSISGTNLNPGTFGNIFGGSNYSTGTYEVDGALYHNICYSQQIPGAWVFRHTSIMKSTDGGRNWLNHKGQMNVVPNDSPTDCTFPNDNMSQMCFVKYGQGGSAPNADNAQTYVYLFSPNACPGDNYYLTRIKRSDLAGWTTTFDSSKVEYYKGLNNADGMLDSNWSIDSTQAQPIYSSVGQCLQAGMMYDYGLQRYLLIPANSDSWANPQVESTIYLLESPHPWGPFTKVIEENVQNKEGDNLTWTYPIQKFASSDGKKVWMTATGRSPYGLQFMPLYMTTNPVSEYQAENATLTGVNTAVSKVGYTGSGYVAGFDITGDKCKFTVNVANTGDYIFKVRYNTTAHQTISVYINGIFKEQLKLGKSEQVYADWTDITFFSSLNNGNNTITIQKDSNDSGALNLDSIKLALYSTTLGSLPGCNPPGTQTPYGGINWSLPGKIEAENYDEGGESTCYHDTDTANNGGATYRSADGVDIENCTDSTGGYDVCWTNGGEWLEYSVNIPNGTYNITARVASQSGSGMSITAKLDGITLGTINLGTTGGWQIWKDFTLNGVNISNGGNGKVLRLEINGGSFNLNNITFTLVSSGDEPSLNTTYKILNKGSGKVMGIENNSTLNNAKNDQYDWVGYASQFWTFEDAGDNMYKIKNNNSGKYLGISDNSTLAGAYNDQYTWGGYLSQFWRIESVGDGYYKIINNNSGMALQPEGNSNLNSVKLVQQPWDSLNNYQQWSFIAP